MEQRVKETGGILSISSKYGEGCCIQISIPITNPEITMEDAKLRKGSIV
jgi:chemotaxis protein histidine kinase CheA